MIIDIHNHLVPREAVALIERDGKHYDTEIIERDSRRLFLIAGSATRPITPKMCEPAARLADMDAWGVDLQAVSPVPFLMYPNIDIGAARTMAQTLNDGLLDAALESPARFAPLGVLPLQSPSDARDELERIAAKGVTGIEIPSSVGSVQLDDPALEPVFAAAEALGVLVCIHPFDACPEAPFDRYALGNLAGNLFDTGLAATLLIYGGVLERHPDLRVMLYHGGGTLAALIDRLDKGYEIMPGCRSALPRPPSTYLDQLMIDTVVFSAEWLAHLIARFGAEQVCMGTDYPLPMGPKDPVADIRALSLNSADEEAILGGNAQRILRLEKSI